MSAQSLKGLLDRITPGPWANEDPMGRDVGLCIVQAGVPTYEWEFIASVHRTTREDGDDHAGRAISSLEQDANARAIALVPELLAVAVAASAILYMAEEWFKHGGDETTFADDFERELEAARSALAALDAKMKEMG